MSAESDTTAAARACEDVHPPWLVAQGSSAWVGPACSVGHDGTPRRAGFSRLLAASCAVAAAVVVLSQGCQSATPRDSVRDDEIRRLVVPTQLQPARLQSEMRDVRSARESDLGGALEVSERSLGPHTVAQLAYQDDLTALARHESLVGSGIAGLRLVIGWMRSTPPFAAASSTRRELDGTDHDAQRDAVRAARRIVECAVRLITQTRLVELGLGHPDRLAAETAVERWLQATLDWQQEQHGHGASGAQGGGVVRDIANRLWYALAHVYSRRTAERVAWGLRDADAATQVEIARHLTAFPVWVEESVSADQLVMHLRQSGVDARWRSSDRDVIWLGEEGLAGSVRVDRQSRSPDGGLGTRLVFEGPWMETGQAADLQEPWRSWRERWLAAWHASPVLIALLQSESLATRSMAAQTLRQLTGIVARYRARADALTRERSAMRWSARLLPLSHRAEAWLSPVPNRFGETTDDES